MATHEQLDSTSSRSPLDPTTTSSSKSEGPSKTTINIGTRRSLLAVKQAEIVQAALQKAYPEYEFEIHAMATMGDKNQVTALHEFGAKSLWTFELEAGLLEKRLDLIVHCVKDMPTQLPSGCTIGCMLDREDPRDVVIMKEGLSYKTLSELPAGSIVGTSSVRRMAQLKRAYSGLEFRNCRGNLGTRLGKLDSDDGEDYTCLILAAAGILRLDLGDRISQYLDSKTPGGGVLYAVGQGALAIEIREGDERTAGLLKGLTEEKVWLECTAERSLMRTLEGGCSVPIGVESEWVEKGKLLMRGIVVSLDGSEAVEVERLGEVLTTADAEEFGLHIAGDLVEKGAGKILEAINLNRAIIEKAGGA